MKTKLNPPTTVDYKYFALDNEPLKAQNRVQGTYAGYPGSSINTNGPIKAHSFVFKQFHTQRDASVICSSI